MPRRALCAGGCGALLWLGTTSSPDATCRPCRAIALRRICARESCTQPFTPHYGGQRYCSRTCAGAERRRQDKPRRRQPRPPGDTTANGLGWAHQQERKAALAALRDGVDCCHFCGHPMSRTQNLDLDHLMPRALGGIDGETTLTHSSCNRRHGSWLAIRPHDPIPLHGVAQAPLFSKREVRQRLPKPPKPADLYPRDAACEGCGTLYEQRGKRHRFCDECAVERNRDRARERGRRLSATQSQATDLYPRPASCQECGISYEQRVSNHRFCAKCAAERSRRSQQAWRQQKRQGAEPLRSVPDKRPSAPRLELRVNLRGRYWPVECTDEDAQASVTA